MTGAERMRLLRERRKDGIRVFPIRVSQELVEAWIDAELLLDPDDTDGICKIVAEIVEEHGLLYGHT